MNIRMDSKEIRFRLIKEEIGILLSVGFLKEVVCLPCSGITFQVSFGDRSRIVQDGDKVTFWISPEVRDKLKSSSQGKEPIAVVEEQINGKQVCFKLEVDIFDSRKREQRL